jgi:hypothetical protein
MRNTLRSARKANNESQLREGETASTYALLSSSRACVSNMSLMNVTWVAITCNAYAWGKGHCIDEAAPRVQSQVTYEICC